MKTKPMWTCANEAGEKFYYYSGLGWINAATGLVVEIDLPYVVTRPADATHVQIHNGGISWVKRTVSGDFCLQDDRGQWVNCGAPLSGTVVNLCDGYATLVRCENGEGFNVWQGGDHIDALLDSKTCVVVKLRNGQQRSGVVGDFDWRHSPPFSHADIVGWRYA